MAKKEFINKDQIARSIAVELKLPITKVLNLIEEIEAEIGSELKAKGRVKLTNFGTFYVIKRTSRIIKQISNQSSRLLLEGQMIKFKPSSLFKQVLQGIKPQPARIKHEERTREKTETKQPTIQKPAAKNRLPEFEPLAIMPRVEKENIRKKIYERMLKLAEISRPEIKNEANLALPAREIPQKTAEERLFSALFKQIINFGSDNLHFSLTDSAQIEIYSGRPRKKLAQLPAPLVRKFLANTLELEHFEIPQERTIKIILEGNPKQSFFLTVYSLPHVSGASLYFKIGQRKIINK